VQFTNEEIAPGPDEFTQQMDANEVQKLLGKKKSSEQSHEDEDSVIEDPNLPPIQANVLPDVYPEQNGKR
jgi:hypothetical protein